MLATSITVDVWAAVGGAATLTVAIFWLVYLELRYQSRERDLRSHEDLCAARYLAIEQRSALLVKASDERHGENVKRFDAISEHLVRQDEKLDRLLEKKGR